MPTLRWLLALLAGLAVVPAAHAARFTYHGELMDGDAPAQGRYDLEVRAFATPAGAKALGEATVLPSVEVKDGRFAVEVDLPEDADGMTWVQVGVRASESKEAFTALGDRQPINKGSTSCPGAWALDGNIGLPAGSFLGIADPAVNTTLELRAKNSAVARFTPNNPVAFGDAPAVALGSSANAVSSFGATVAGGGSTHSGGGVACPTCLNESLGNFATVGGGQANLAGNSYATVAGGRGNVATLGYATVSGGDGNRAGGLNATVPGGVFNFAGGDGSFAAGTNARVRTGGSAPAIVPFPLTAADYTGTGVAADHGSFVWADNGGGTARTTGPDQFLVRAEGGVAINGTPPFSDAELTVFGVADDAFGGFVEVRLAPSLNGTTGEGIELGASKGGAGNNDADFRIAQRNSVNGFTAVLTIGSDGITSVKNGNVADVSDARLKKNLRAIDQPLDTLLALRGHVFEYIDPVKAMNAPGPRMGFIAQEIQATLPNWVTRRDDGYLQVSTIGFEALAVEAIRDLKADSDVRIEGLEAENAALRSSLGAVLQRLERLEARQEH